MTIENGNEKEIRDYYREMHPAYENWGRYEDRGALYAIHSGYHSTPTMTHREALVEMEQRIAHWVGLSKETNLKVGDFGCGVGGVTAFLASSFPKSDFFGITITDRQALIGQGYLKERAIKNAALLLATYMKTPFESAYFDRIIFIESLMHAANKRAALGEAVRVLKPGGRVHFQDPVLKFEPETEDQKSKVRKLAEGFCMPTFYQPLEDFLGEWEQLGLRIIMLEELSKFVYPSAVRIGSHARASLQSRPNVAGTERARRVGATVLDELFDGYEQGKNVVGYYAVQAVKI